jgi:hypothetical protein
MIRSVESIGTYAFAYCDSLNTVVILTKAIDIGPYAFYGDSAITQINATAEIRTKVLNSCQGTCSAVQDNSSSSDSNEINPGTIIAIIFIIKFIIFIAIYIFRWIRSTQKTNATYGAVQGVEMQHLPSGPIEVQAIPLVSPYPVAGTIAAPPPGDKGAVTVYCHNVVNPVSSNHHFA